MGSYVRLTVTNLLDAAGVDPTVSRLARTTRTVWCRVPGDWVVDGWLLPGRRNYLASRLDGPQEATRLVVADVRAKVLTDREATARPWLAARAACYICEPDTAPRPVLPVEL